MYTLAEVGGTFVAILAGLYTTKIISISADKTRLENKINEILIKINSKKQRLTILQNKIDEVDKMNDENRVNGFIQNCLVDLEENLDIDNFKDLKSKYEKVWELTYYEEKCLKDFVLSNIAYQYQVSLLYGVNIFLCILCIFTNV
jgi:hypothetical protein